MSEHEAAQAFLQQQHMQQQQQAAAAQAHAQQSNVGSINLTPQQLQEMLASVGNQAAHQAVHAVQASHAQSSAPSALPKNVLNLIKPPPYENKSKSGKFIHFERGVRQFVRVQGFQPDMNGQHNQQCRTIVEICCIGEALSYIHRLAETLPAHHPFWTYEGLLKSLKEHFTFEEETDEARHALDNLKLTKGMSARTYVQKFNSLLEDIPQLSTKDMLFAFTKGLPNQLQMWIRHDRPESLEDAQNLVIRMSGTEPSPAGPEPMQLDSLQQTLQQTTDRLARLEMVPRQHAPRARDPRKDPRWPRWGRVHDSQLRRCKEGNLCFLCFKDGHQWPECPRLKGQRSPSALSLQDRRSPSPPGSWRVRPGSPPRGRPNA